MNDIKKITGRMLLTHTAGFRNYMFFGDNDKLLIHFEPGTQFHYSGEGIIILQGVIENNTGEDLTSLSEKYLFNGLRMTRTSYIWQDRFDANTTSGFNQEGGVHRDYRPQEPMAAASKTLLSFLQTARA